MRLRAAVAFVIAPAFVPASLYLHAWTLGSQQQLDRVSIGHSLTFLLSYGLAITVGMPMYRYMERYDHRLLRHYLAGGAIIGAIPGFALFLSALPSLSAGIRFPVITGSLVGALSAAVFWLIGIRDTAAGSNKTMEPTR
jgi:ABC-type proline/glycine betaine transport system permease subunit